MKVESVGAFPIRIRAEEDLRGGTFGYAEYQTVLVKVTVDGVAGWGEAMTRSEPRATSALAESIGGRIVGRDYATVREAWDGAWRELRVRGHTRGVEVEALSGIEMALSDAAGKLRRRRLCEVLAAKCVPEVRAFAGSIFASRGPLGGQVELAKESGLAGAKVKVGFGIDEDARILRQVRTLWPEALLVADANGAYDGTAARRAASAFAPLDLAWFEEPVLSDDLEGYASLKGAGVKIGAGESWFPGDFRRPIAEGLIGVVEPSVSRCGGVGVELEVARDAAARGIAFSPMTGMNSALSLAASIHVASAVGSIGVEFNPFPNPLQTELGEGMESPRDGMIRVPAGPGLGIEVDERFVKSHSSA